MVEGLNVRGATQKDVLQDPDTGHIYIAKLGGRNNDVEVMTEYIIYLIGRSLAGVKVAEAKIATFHGQLRFLSCYFLDSQAPEELVHGMQLFKELYDDTTIEGVLRDLPSEQSFFSVQSVKSAFGAHYYNCGPNIEERLFDGFVAMLTHDALIGVQDRHHENWGVIVQRSVEAPEPRFAPLYDSARGLFCNSTDAQLKKNYVGKEGDQRVDGYIGRSRPLVGFLGMTPKGRSYLTHDQLLAAVFQAFPRQRPIVTSVLESYDWRRVRSDVMAELRGLCTPHRMAVILTCLRRRLRAIYRALHGTRPGADILE